MEKTCRLCNISKPLESFSLKSNGSNGRNSRCRECIKQIDRERWINMSEEEKQKRRDKQNIMYKLGKRKIVKRTKEQERDKRRKQRMKIEYRVKDNLRERVRKFISKRSYNKYSETYNMIGCSPTFLKEFIESKFKDGMSWDNYGKWHIDHIIPLCTANDEEGMRKLCHYTNLQPLWADENLKKGGKIIHTK